VQPLSLASQEAKDADTRGTDGRNLLTLLQPGKAAVVALDQPIASVADAAAAAGKGTSLASILADGSADENAPEAADASGEASTSAPAAGQLAAPHSGTVSGASGAAVSTRDIVKSGAAAPASQALVARSGSTSMRLLQRVLQMDVHALIDAGMFTPHVPACNALALNNI
jgi:hypothetical protein